MFLATIKNPKIRLFADDTTLYSETASLIKLWRISSHIQDTLGDADLNL